MALAVTAGDDSLLATATIGNVTVAGGEEVTVYTNDAAGNPLQVQDPDGSRTYYAWNALGQMATAEPAAGVVTMSYNAAGQRVRKESNDGAVTNFLYDFKTLLQESDADDDPTRSYTAAEDEYGDLISTFDDGADTPAEFYHQFDAQYSTNALTDDSGSVTQQFKYQAFGLPIPNRRAMSHICPRS